MAKRRRGAKSVKQTAQEHIEVLSGELNKQRYTDSSLAQRYIDLIRRVGMKFRLRLPRHIKRQYCKHCKTLLYPGRNSRIRFRKGVRVVYCYKCKKFTRWVYKGKKAVSTSRHA